MQRLVSISQPERSQASYAQAVHFQSLPTTLDLDIRRLVRASVGSHYLHSCAGVLLVNRRRSHSAAFTPAPESLPLSCRCLTFYTHGIWPAAPRRREEKLRSES